MPTPQETLRDLRAGIITLDEAEHRLTASTKKAIVTPVAAPVAPPSAAQVSAPASNSTEVTRSREKIAIIGMSGRYPGAVDLEHFWQNLAQAKCSIREIPASRWDVQRYFRPLPIQKGKMYCKWMGVLDDVDRFDPLFFNISPTEAEVMDPQQRIFLQEAYRAIEDAGYTSRSLSANRCGVYLGIMNNEYLTMLQQRQAEAVDTTGNSFAIAAARLSYFLNLKGPAIAIDTACSSSLVATHLGCQALLSGEIDMAVVGGVTLYLSPVSYLGMCSAGMLSPDGQCRAFDQGANGFVPGEGAGALVLKRLKEAERDGDLIYGLIAGSAINQDGKTNGITAPSMRSQTAVAREVYEKAGIDPGDLGYVEMHGTGTKLGDPVELEALSAAFKERTKRRRYCAIGSVKSNIGHTSAAAGVAGLHKVLLCLQHGELPPTLNVTRPNEHFDFDDSPFYINTTLRRWDAGPGRPRRAGVSSFGFSGTNAHLVVEEYRPRTSAPRRSIDAAPVEPLLFLLSAKNEERLRAQAGQLRAWVEGEAALEVSALAFTLQVARESFDHRLAFLAHSREAVLRALEVAAEGRRSTEVLTGHAKRSTEESSLLQDDEDVEALLHAWLEKKKLAKLAKAWLRGVDVDWARLYGDSKPRKLHLPGYPFDPQRCWMPEVSGQPTPAGAGPVLHPLLHQNVSDLFEQRYTSVFTGRELFLSDHVVQGSPVMPGAALLEMARAAVAQALKTNDGLCLEAVSWSKPLIVDGRNVRVDVCLSPEDGQVIGFEISARSPGPEEERVVHSRGRVRVVPATDAPTVNLEALRASCTRRVLSAAQCYAAFKAAGIHYGPAHRGVEAISVGDGQAVASLCVPACVSEEQDRFVLHPSLLDSALQASAGLVAESGPGGGLALPIALEGLRVFGPTAGVRWAHVRQGASGRQDEHRFDLDLCDEQGHVRVRVTGFTVRVFPKEGVAANRTLEVTPSGSVGAVDGVVTLAPVWDAVTTELRAPAGELAVLVGADEAAVRAVRATLPEARVLELAPEDSVERIALRIEAAGAIDHLIWIAPRARDGFLVGDAYIEDQAKGVLQLFRLVKALLRVGYGARALEWTVITVATQRVSRADQVDPTHASVHGFMGSLAKEYPRWRVRLADLDRGGEQALGDALRLPTDPLGRALARRGGEWLRRKLVPVQAPRAGHGGFRAKGVYVIIGGAGGLGEVWSEYLIRTYQANVVWLGRRAHDPSIQGKIDRLAALGPAPIYLRADARDRDALAGAYQDIKARFARVHGVVHAAIDLRDQSLAKMDEAAFEAGLTAKVDVGVRLAQLFRNDTLDFVLFFSSAQSFQNAAGQANYASGCAFEDALAHRLAREWPCAVKVMNWGYWGGQGAVATSAYQERMAKAGIGSIEPAEGMEALESLLAGPTDQLVFLKTTRPVQLEGTDTAEVVDAGLEAFPSALKQLGGRLERSDGGPVSALAARHRVEMDELLGALVKAQLATMGVAEGELKAGTAGRRVRREFHRRWLEETSALLGLGRPEAHPLPRGAQADAVWREWDAKRTEWAKDPDRQAQVRLLDAMLRGLPAILTGERLATDVMFPGSSFELVEGIYKQNPVADYFNGAIADAVAAVVAKRVERDASLRIRILEIGGGTGGTTTAVLGKLAPWAANIAEYCFTDISSAFLARAEAAWAASHPYLRTTRFDVENSPRAQGLEAGAFDIAIAANVLHATRGIRNTLRNAKATLKRHGVLVASEISAKTLFTHLTVGLLDGWWLYEDPALRIPGCPGLCPDSWRAVLSQEGFGRVVFPAHGAHETGQQLIVAESDGLVRRRASARSAEVPAVEPLVETRAPTVEETATSARAPAEGQVRGSIVAALSKSLKVSADALDADDAFSNYGVDSISGVRLVQALNETLGIDLTPTDLFDHGSVNRLTSHILERFGAQVGPRVPASTREAPLANAVEPKKPAPISAAPRAFRRLVEHAPEDRSSRDVSRQMKAPGPIAVIGMSGRFARSQSLDELWAHLANGDDLVQEVGRWDLSRVHASGARYCRHGSFLDDIDCFDPLFFKIAGTEARYMDPQQRLFLEESWKALEDAGYAGAGVAGRACGVYVGCGGGDYQTLFAGEPPAQAFWGNAESIIPARIAYHLDLQGPAIAVDTACSSSLVAVHLACQSLWAGETEMALAGGVFLQTTPAYFQSAERAGMLSAEGRCHAFDERADGFVPGEGVGAVVLKRLDDALADGDHIHGLIRGSAINQDGATNGITAPSARSQERLERRVYESFGIDPAGIQLVEAHGTGTKLGDPIEVDALTRAFRGFTDKSGYCALGSIKSNIGHATHAAGVAGLFKVLLALRHRQIPPSLHFRKANPNVRLEGSPFYVATALEPWKVEGREARRAAVSSFGFSGTNAHVVVEEPPLVTPTPGRRSGFLIALSARTPEQLRHQVERLVAYCERQTDLDLGAVSQTLLLGRKLLDHRLACVASDRKELVERLRTWLTAGRAAQVCAGEAPQGTEERRRAGERGARSVERCREAGQPAEYLAELKVVAECFVGGAALDVGPLFEGERRARVSLPTYPFARERYWVPQSSASPVAASVSNQAEGPTRLHPLVGRNVSTLQEERFATRLTQEEFYVSQHRIDGRAILPGVAFLEMARAAGVLAAEQPVLALKDVAWLKPVIVPEEGIEISVSVDAQGDGAGFEVTSSGAAGEPEVHGRGRLVFSGGGEEEGGAPAGERLDLSAIAARCTARFSARDCYERLESLGLHLGPALRTITELRVGPGEVLASLELPQELLAERAEFLLHPALMDGALQAGIGLELESGRDFTLHVPFALGEVEVLGPLSARGVAHFVLTSDGANRRAEVRVADEAGQVLVRMKGFAARPARSPSVNPRIVGKASRAETVVFDRVWEPEALELTGSPERHLQRAMIVFAGDRALFDALSRARVDGEGPRPLLAMPGARYEAQGEGVFTVRLGVEEDFDRLLGELGSPPSTLTLAYVGSSAVDPSRATGERRQELLRRAEDVLLGLLHAVRAVKRRFRETELVVVSLVPLEGDVSVPAVAAGGGFMRVIGLELSRIACKTVELPYEGGAFSAQALRWGLDELEAGVREEMAISYRGGQRRRATWREAQRHGGAGVLTPRGAWVITGGMGGLGRVLSRHLASRSGARLVLCGRAPMDEAKQQHLRELERRGAEAIYVQADVSRADEVEGLVARAKERFGGIQGVFHAAGTTRDSLAMKKTREEIEVVLAPKVLGTVFLDEATREEPLDFFVLFSSVAAVLGNAGQSDYAYANAFMDAYADVRKDLARRGARSGRTVSIDWPLWREGGLSVDEPGLELMRATTGMTPLETNDGLAALDEILASADGQVLVLAGDRERLVALARRGVAPRSSGADEGARDRSAQTIERETLELASTVVGLDVGLISVEKSLVEYGFDSLSFATLAQRLGVRFGIALSPACFFEFPTVRSLAAHLLEEWGEKLTERPVERTERSTPTGAPAKPAGPSKKADRPGRTRAGARLDARGREPVAIIGLSGVMPGSEDLEAFWAHLAAGDDLITEVPRDRWERAGFAAALARAGEADRALWGGFLKEVDKFDALFFGISPREAELMDPQQRIFLEMVWRAVEDAGYRMSELAGTRTGLFVGASTADYGDIVRSSGVKVEGHMATGLAPSVLANRISYLFDLRGPSEPVDTACSSSLIALHRAVEALSTGGCELAIAGGVNALLTPNVFVSFIKAGMLSPDGRCKTFDRRANGYVRGEGAGAVLLKPLGRAQRDGDHIYGLIRATAVNHGGRASSLTAPNMLAQADVLLEAYERAGVDPATVNYIEAHGTGTALGDPIEVDGLKRAFTELFKRRGQQSSVRSCGLGSVKSNVGHLEAAAGMAGLIKVLLALKHRTLPATIHFDELNPYIRLEGSPFYVVEEKRPWEPARGPDGRLLPRRAGISSFGFGGANAHVVLEEHEPSSRARALETRPEILVLSAKSEVRLRASAESLLRYVGRSDDAAESVDLGDLAYTLQLGREPHEHRLAIVASSSAELRARLEAWCAGRDVGSGLVSGSATRSKEVLALLGDGGEVEDSVARVLADRKMEKLAALWVSGLTVDWRVLHQGRAPRRLALPTYPFARERYWLDPPEHAATAVPVSPVATADDGQSWRERLAAPGAPRQELLETFLSDQITRMLKLSGSQKLDRKQPLISVGFDSLMALQLKKIVGSQLALDVSLVKILGGESTADLAARILAHRSSDGASESEMHRAALDPPHDEVLEGVL